MQAQANSTYARNRTFSIVLSFPLHFTHVTWGIANTRWKNSFSMPPWLKLKPRWPPSWDLRHLHLPSWDAQMYVQLFLHLCHCVNQPLISLSFYSQVNHNSPSSPKPKEHCFWKVVLKNENHSAAPWRSHVCWVIRLTDDNFTTRRAEYLSSHTQSNAAVNTYDTYDSWTGWDCAAATVST